MSNSLPYLCARTILARNFMVLFLLATAFGCAAQQPWSFNLGDFLAAKELPYDSPPQVIYRIDDHRFVTLEHYRDCNHGETFYHDTKKNFRRKLGIGYFENYQGKIINADPSGNNIVLPLATPPRLVCGDRGCTVVLLYSMDGGKNFQSMVYMPHSFNPYEDSKQYTILIDKNRIYIEKIRQRDSYIVSYPLIPGYDYSGRASLPKGAEIQFDIAMPAELQTPSGQNRISCDASIKPTNLDAPIVRERQ